MAKSSIQSCRLPGKKPSLSNLFKFLRLTGRKKNFKTILLIKTHTNETNHNFFKFGRNGSFTFFFLYERK
jgi:hypothetical protein